MGCGASAHDGSTSSLSNKEERNNSANKNASNNAITNKQAALEKDSVPNGKARLSNSPSENGPFPNQIKPTAQNKENSIVKKNGTVPKSVAFDVSLDNNKLGTTPGISAPPKRLKLLEPIENAPKLTAQMLDEKLRAAEEKRTKELDKIRETSRKSTKVRSRILEAQQFELQQQTQNINQEIEEKQKSAAKKKEKKRLEMEEKRKMREERARRARERAKEMKGEQELDFEIEKDENYDSDEGVWLDDDYQSRETSAHTDRIYSGRSSPAKKHRPLTSAEQRARIINSASTTDSFDYAFQRQSNKSTKDTWEEDDDFFG